MIQANGLAAHLAQTIVAMITSNLARSGHPSRVTILIGTASSQGSGLRTDSVVMTDNIATVLDGEIDKVIGALPDMSSIDVALRYTLGCNLRLTERRTS